MLNRQSATCLVLVCFLVIGTWLAGAVGQSPQRVPTSQLPSQGSGVMQVVGVPGEPFTTVIYDSDQQVLGVYHIDRQSGEIELKSIRQIEWDLKMLHFQGKAPLPQDIKNGLESAGAG